MIALLKHIALVLQSILLPPFCTSCGALGSYLCKRCKDTINPSSRQVCCYCLRPAYAGITHHRCRRRRGLDGAYHSFLYDGVVRKVVFKTKYGLRHQLLTDFLNEFQEAIVAGFTLLLANKEPILIPVPLHMSKVRKRGFNQAEILARWLAKETGLPVQKSVMRIRNTSPQSSLISRKDRRRNIIGAFRYVSKERPIDTTAIIVDDIWTSGSTAKEMCRLLKRVGFKTVYLFTLAGPYGH
ncbi:MAG: DNA utilization protein GntX [Microgenomates bacterium OLB22]|nr:MAG: DNA utilization protein GntX [Microgenomates bacterium OLB22]